MIILLFSEKMIYLTAILVHFLRLPTIEAFLMDCIFIVILKGDQNT